VTNQNPAPQEAPHFTKELLIDAMRHLSADFAAAQSGAQSVDSGDERALSRLAHAQKIGLDKLAPEAVATMESAMRAVRELTWPGGLDQRYLGLVGVVETLARISTELLPHNDKTAHLTDFAPVMHASWVASGRRLRARLADRMRGLCVVIDPQMTKDRPVTDIAEQALNGGALAIQLRVAPGDIATAERVHELCAASGALFVVEDRADIAAAVKADGVRLPENGLPLDAVRKVLTPWQIAGTSSTTADEARSSIRAGADYVAMNTADGFDALRALRMHHPEGGPPLIAYRGITAKNVAEAANAGADGFCVTTAVTESPNPQAAAERLIAAFKQGQ
jgi:thiamine-phosphate pyrophosphorylase